MKRRKEQQYQRQLRRQAAKWLLALTNDMDWGMKVWDDLEQKTVPKHRNTKQQVLAFLQKVPCAYPRRPTQKAILQHFLGEETVYFTGSRGDETLLMLDIDCAPDVSGSSLLATGVDSGDHVDNVARPWPFGRPPYLGGTLMESVTHRQESSPDNAGHWRSSVALVVLIGRVSARLRKEPTDTFGEIDTTSPLTPEPPGKLDPGIGDVLAGRWQSIYACGPRQLCQIHGQANYLVMSRGAAVRCQVCDKSRSLNRND